MNPTAVTAGPPAVALQRLHRLIVLDSAITATATLVILAVHVFVVHRRYLVVLAVVVGMAAVGMVCALAPLRRGRATAAVAILAASNYLVAVVVAVIATFALPILLVTTALPVVVAVPYVSERSLRRYGHMTLLASCAVAVLASVQDVTGLSESVSSNLRIAMVLLFMPPMAALFGAVALTNDRAFKASLRQALTANAELVDAQATLVRRAEELRRSRDRVIAATYRERHRIERRISRGVQQQLAALDDDLIGVERQVAPLDPDLAAQLTAVRDELQVGVVDLQRIAAGIYPTALTEHGLAAAIMYEAERLPIPVEVIVGLIRRYSADVEQAVYFCCLEALQNTMKHAGPTAVATVTITEEAGVLTIRVRDDGTGFDRTKPASVPASSQSGLRNMADRLAAVEGELSVYSEPGQGTTVAGEIPLPAPNRPSQDIAFHPETAKATAPQATPPEMVDTSTTDAAIRRLRRLTFVGMAMTANAAVALLAVHVYIASSRYMLLLSAMLALSSAAMAGALAPLRNGQVNIAVGVLAAANYGVAISTTIIAPFSMPTNLAICMLPVTLAVPYVSLRALRWYVAATFATTLGVAVLGLLQNVSDLSSAVPAWYPEFVVVAFTPFPMAYLVVVALTNGNVVRESMAKTLRARVDLGDARRRLLRLTEDLGRSRGRAIEAGDLERRRIERDLHDGAQQRLVGVAVRLAICQPSAEQLDPVLASRLVAARRELQEAIGELRELAHGIYPPALADRGVLGALRNIAAEFPRRVSLDLQLTGRYPAEVERALCFCCLEALHNAARHAGAEAQVSLSVIPGNDVLRFVIHDTGSGFDRSQVVSDAGLRNMEDRIAAVDGQIHIESSPGDGATVHGHVPITLSAITLSAITRDV